jgi:outer membrane biosynthesis protein TonB
VKPKPPAAKPKPPAAKPKPPAAKPPAPKPKPKPPAVEMPPPAKHPAVTCQTIRVSTKTLVASRKPQKLTLTIKRGAARAPGAIIVFRGPGILRIARAGGNGVAVVTVRPPKPGVLRVSVRRLRACEIQEIGIAKPKKPPITG